VSIFIIKNPAHAIYILGRNVYGNSQDFICDQLQKIILFENIKIFIIGENYIL
jgi:hypothetical protein